ncbi:MAG: bifunctional diaminohydroxyphosphoribosylaminopyrimidine deaminase/5-amino-6-(5-phosphoribosylamino)uracil reductase RibD [Roseivirga sp.]|nr:bifunctional diaminohydroxyphosphoribosylaminopyrimidine deaminase/5-amino-6-(5-phosphoribosylamino)uracil reductase RibD [Roseivirga sp.]
MQRALDLAEKGWGTVSPNPLVGCVIVHDEKIIGEGWHRKYGEGHAEVNAIASVADKTLLSESTCYVSLEPCAHYGKTPPCADLLIELKVKRVVVAVKDSNPLVGGKGITRMESAGIQVDYGMLEEKARELNARFFTAIEKQRPYILLKWAQTRDGFVARKNFDSKWISGKTSRQLVHQMRAEEDAIMVGTNTSLHDDPKLNVRGVEGTDPLRVVIDKELRLPEGLQLFDGNQPTVCYNLKKSESHANLDFVKLKEDGFIRELFANLHSRKVQSVLVEGGSGLLNSLIREGLWDEARVFQSETTFGEGIAAPVLTSGPIETMSIGNDDLRVYRNV